MKYSAPTTILLAGVGGQGVISAGKVLADAAFNSGLDVKTSEVHGLSRRFGSVACQVRFGGHSPLCGHGAADVLVALEVREGLRQLPYLHATGVGLVNRHWIGEQGEQGANEPRVYWIDGSARARALGRPASLNLFMLGVLAGLLPMDDDAWREAIRRLLTPATLSDNLVLFVAGQRCGAETNLNRSQAEIST